MRPNRPHRVYALSECLGSRVRSLVTSYTTLLTHAQQTARSSLCLVWRRLKRSVAPSYGRHWATGVCDGTPCNDEGRRWHEQSTSVHLLYCARLGTSISELPTIVADCCICIGQTYGDVPRNRGVIAQATCIAHARVKSNTILFLTLYILQPVPKLPDVRTARSPSRSSPVFVHRLLSTLMPSSPTRVL